MDGAMHDVGKWDLLIAHPPCTDLSVAGAASFAKKRQDKKQEDSIRFFMEFFHGNATRIAVENPVCIMSTVFRKPDQIIQPWQFGDNYSKTTCLWLVNLPKLTPKTTTEPHLEWFYWTDKRTGKQKRSPKWYAEAYNLPREERAKVRSKTFPGIAEAMAEQWGKVEGLGPVQMNLFEMEDVEDGKETRKGS